MDEIFQNSPAKIAELMQAVERGGDVSIPDFARLVALPESVLRRMWQNGNVPSGPGETIPMREGVVALVSCPRAGRPHGQPCPQFLRYADNYARELIGLPARDSEPLVSRVDDSAQAVPDDSDELKKWKLKFLQIQTAAKSASAEKLKIENDIKKGVYVKAAEVELDAATTAANVSSAFARLPARVAGMCVGHNAEEIAAILRKEIDLIFSEIQNSAFTGIWQ